MANLSKSLTGQIADPVWLSPLHLRVMALALVDHNLTRYVHSDGTVNIGTLGDDLRKLCRLNSPNDCRVAVEACAMFLSDVEYP